MRRRSAKRQSLQRSAKKGASTRCARAKSNARAKEKRRLLREQARIRRRERREAVIAELQARVKGNLAYLGGLFSALPKKFRQRRERARKAGLQKEKAALVAAISEEIKFLKSRGINVIKEEKAISKLAKSLSEAEHG